MSSYADSSLSSHPAALGFWASSSPDSITLIPANKKTDQSLSDFQTSTGAAVHATLDTGHLISYTRVELVDTIASLQGSNGGVIAASEVNELLTRTHEILDSVSVVSKHTGNLKPILNI